jgi:hypothetical protein
MDRFEWSAICEVSSSSKTHGEESTDELGETADSMCSISKTGEMAESGEAKVTSDDACFLCRIVPKSHLLLFGVAGVLMPDGDIPSFCFFDGDLVDFNASPALFSALILSLVLDPSLENCPGFHCVITCGIVSR